MDIRALAYIVAQSATPQNWAPFGEQVIGLAARTLPGGGVALQADERLGRIFVQPGPRECYFASGWELADEPSFAAALEELDRSGVAYEEATPDQAAARGVLGMVCVFDPDGNRHELWWGFRSDFKRFVSPAGVPRFVTGKLGMGHTVLPAPNFDETRRFFTGVMGLRMADL